MHPLEQVDDMVPIRVHLDRPNEDQAAEDAYFRASENERSQAELYRSLLYVGKAQSILTFDDIVERFGLSFAGRVLELGGGYGFLSAYLKRRFPDVTVTFSDVSRDAVEKSCQYEEFFGSRLDGKWVTSAEDTPFEDGTFDIVFFFASFHHTQEPQRALDECSRVLRPGGRLYLLFEPSCPAYLQPLYDFHVRRDEVKERYYSVGEYKRMLLAAGFSSRHYDYTNYLYRRSRASVLYYVLMSMLPSFARRLLPCSQVVVATRTRATGAGRTAANAADSRVEGATWPARQGDSEASRVAREVPATFRASTSASSDG
jgi:SAM-dependent methyltransferase